jgi:hypothetical protein
MRFNEAKQPYETKKNLENKQTNGNFNDIGSTDKRILKNIPVEPLFKNYKKTRS